MKVINYLECYDPNTMEANKKVVKVINYEYDRDEAAFDLVRLVFMDGNKESGSYILNTKEIEDAISNSTFLEADLFPGWNSSDIEPFCNCISVHNVLNDFDNYSATVEITNCHDDDRMVVLTPCKGTSYIVVGSALKRAVGNAKTCGKYRYVPYPYRRPNYADYNRSDAEWGPWRR